MLEKSITEIRDLSAARHRRPVFASDEFFFDTVRNPHTRAAYLSTVRKFLPWAEGQEIALERITARDVGRYFDQLRDGTSIASRK